MICRDLEGLPEGDGRELREGGDICVYVCICVCVCVYLIQIVVQ